MALLRAQQFCLKIHSPSSPRTAFFSLLNTRCHICFMGANRITTMFAEHNVAICACMFCIHVFHPAPAPSDSKLQPRGFSVDEGGMVLFGACWGKRGLGATPMPCHAGTCFSFVLALGFTSDPPALPPRPGHVLCKGKFLAYFSPVYEGLPPWHVKV